MPDPSSDKSTDTGKPKRHDAYVAVPASFVGALTVAAFTHFMPTSSAQPTQPDLTANAAFSTLHQSVEGIKSDLSRDELDAAADWAAHGMVHNDLNRDIRDMRNDLKEALAALHRLEGKFGTLPKESP